jgi:hypothetical protein
MDDLQRALDKTLKAIPCSALEVSADFGSVEGDNVISFDYKNKKLDIIFDEDDFKLANEGILVGGLAQILMGFQIEDQMKPWLCRVHDYLMRFELYRNRFHLKASEDIYDVGLRRQLMAYSDFITRMEPQS